jgi:hypothetical protein
MEIGKEEKNGKEEETIKAHVPNRSLLFVGLYGDLGFG